MSIKFRGTEEERREAYKYVFWPFRALVSQAIWVSCVEGLSRMDEKQSNASLDLSLDLAKVAYDLYCTNFRLLLRKHESDEKVSEDEYKKAFAKLVEDQGFAVYALDYLNTKSVTDTLELMNPCELLEGYLCLTAEQ